MTSVPGLWLPGDLCCASSRCNLCTRVMFAGCILQLFLEVNAIIFHSDMTVSSINKSRPALHHISTVWKYHHGGCLLASFQFFFFILCFGCSQTQFFLIYTLFPTQMSSPSISASLAPEFGEQPTPSQEPVWDMTSFQVVIKSKCVFCIQHQHGELVLSLALWPVPQSPMSILPCKHSTSDPRVWVTSHCLCDISPSGGMVGLNGLNFIVLAASQG